MTTSSEQTVHDTKIVRFIDWNNGPIKLSITDEFQKDNLITLELCFKPLMTRINRFDQIIQMAKEKCHFPSEHGLTLDESAAIFLYTMEWDNTNLYQLINQDYYTKEKWTSELWNPYLKLFYSALNKLPNIKMNVWRGMNEDMIGELEKNKELTCPNFTSCSSSIDFIKGSVDVKSKLVMIATVTGKNISNYSYWPDQHEILICPGVSLQFLKTIQDPILQTSIICLQESINEVIRKKSSTSSRINDVFRIFLCRCCRKKSLLLLLHIIVLLLVLFFFNPASELSSISSDSQPKRYLSSLIKLMSEILIMQSVPLKKAHVDEFGNRYEGEWKNEKRHGNGKMKYANGYQYTGSWIEDLPEGEGIFIWTNGDQYEGQYHRGQRHGKGVYIYANGDKYTGDWFEDKKSGYGIFIWGPNTAWANDKYEGEFYNDQMHGQGTYSFANAGTYVGGWVNNLQEGEGILNFENGDRFE